MPKSAIRILGLVLVISMAALLVSQRLAIVKLRREMQRVREQHEQIPAPAMENAGFPIPTVETTQSETLPNEPSLELLRLRGEVGRLRREQNEIEEMRNEMASLRQEILVVRGPSLNETYSMSGIDTNYLPEIDLGQRREQVLGELQRVKAKIFEANEKFVHAQSFPPMLTSSNGAVAAIAMELYFEEGKLSSRQDKLTNSATISN